MKKERIWELDAFRGLCILGMIVIHLLYDFVHIAGFGIHTPDWLNFIGAYGHIFFILISGICVTLANRSFKRGVIVFGAGLLVSYVTLFLDFVLGFTHLRIWFGILHLLGVCMMVYPILKKLPAWALAIFGAAFVALGFWLKTVTVSVDYLFPLGLCSGSIYAGSDFFPIFPGLGWFLIGAVIGKTVYKQKKSLLPGVNAAFPLLRGLRFIGRHSLDVYLVHQPVLFLLTLLIAGI